MVDWVRSMRFNLKFEVESIQVATFLKFALRSRGIAVIFREPGVLLELQSHSISTDYSTESQVQAKELISMSVAS